MSESTQTKSTTLPHHLIEQIKAGNVVLFLGAGASFGSQNIQGDFIPNGAQLSKLLSTKFLGNDVDGGLDYISEICISEASLFDVQTYLSSIFKDFEPLPHHLKLPNFIWKAIFTTNYDRIIEKSFEKSDSTFQHLVPVIKNTPKSQIFYQNNVLPYYKIHGCITDINDPDAPLILTPDQFATHSSKRDRLFKELQELIYDYTFVFVGYGMADPDIRLILSNLDKNNTNRVRSYMIGPHVTELEKKLWEAKKISPIKMSFEEFINEIDNAIEINHRKLASVKPKEDLPIYNNFKVSISDIKPTEGFINFITNTIEYVHENISSPNTEPKNFYKGYFNNWDPIIKNLDVDRKIKEGLLYEIFLNDDIHNSSQQNVYLLKGNGGSGKSVLLRQYPFKCVNEKFLFNSSSTSLQR